MSGRLRAPADFGLIRMEMQRIEKLKTVKKNLFGLIIGTTLGVLFFTTNFGATLLAEFLPIASLFSTSPDDDAFMNSTNGANITNSTDVISS